MNVIGGTTDVTTYFVLRLAATGVGATGLTIANMDLTYVRTGAAPAAKVDAVALAATDSAHTDNRAIEVDATNMPGLYRVDWPDAAFAAGARQAILTVLCATCFTEHMAVDIDTPVDVAKISGDAAAADNCEADYDGTGYVGGTIVKQADVTKVGGVAQSATDLKDFADTGYDPTAHKVAGVVLTDTCTTNTDLVTAAAIKTAIEAAGSHLTLILEDTGTTLDGIVDAILEDTGTTLPSTLSTIAAYIDTEVAAILEDTGTTLPATLATIDTVVDAIKAVTDVESGVKAAVVALNDLSAAEVNAEVVDALGTDALTELSQAKPTATPTIKTALMLLYMIARNKLTTTATELGVYNDAGTKIAEKALSDDGTTYTEAEMESGA